MTTSRRLLLATAIGLTVGFLAVQIIERWTTDSGDRPVPLRGIPGVGGPFRLTSHRGDRVDETTFRGKVQVLFFGFTNCPDVCPTALNLMSDLLDQLGSDARQFQPIFVTVDPERDTTEVLARYVAAFHESIVGLTGTETEIATIAKAFHVYYKKVAIDSALGYVMDHTASIYVLDREGVFRSTLDIHQATDEALAVLRRFITKAS